MGEQPDSAAEVGGHGRGEDRGEVRAEDRGQGRGPARGPRKERAILDATLDLLAEQGYDGLTVEGVAARSGVNKTTLYRYWPSKGALLSAALIGSDRLDLAVPDTGSLRGDLDALVRQVVALLTEPPAADIAVAALGAATRGPELAGAVAGFFADRLAREQAVFDRAVARGELAADTDPALVMDLLAGAVWLRAVLRRRPLEPEFAARTVAAVLDGLTPAR
ncbi:TetR/AcrR family transcriptional regulator [Kitasatospora camelliae]|uniref:TetR/AcrR family transcriptional regulator n=1 Tax=Kitasatospora camelliae TaxID=3156397 RepID=A0AAU8JQ98_9ACTN